MAVPFWSQSGSRAFIRAAANGYLETTKYLVERGADVNAKDHVIPLLSPALFSAGDALRLTNDVLPALQQLGLSAVYQAKRNGHQDVVELLLAAGALDEVCAC